MAYSLAPVGPDAVGGAEQVLTQLDAGITAAGHQSIVVACEGSITTGVLLATPRPNGQLDEITRRKAAACHRNAILRALESWPIDVIHFHGIDVLEYLPPAGVPALITLHLPLSWYPDKIFALERPNTFLNCVSATQQQGITLGRRALAPVPNSVPNFLFSAHHAKRSFALSLGRICPEKGFHISLDAARKAGLPLLLAGKVFSYQAHQEYFQQEIIPRLDRLRRFIGAAGAKRKRRLLGSARCVVIPSLVPETSSLVAMEALACGTPVVAFPTGALSEIVEDGKTGFLVSNERELSQALRAVSSLDPQRCRESARQRFSLERMLSAYLEIYRTLGDLVRRDSSGRESHASGVDVSFST